jgi:hypothetical protein
VPSEVTKATYRRWTKNLQTVNFFPFLCFFSAKGPRSRRYGRTAALRLLVQPCDEDDDDDDYYYYFFVVFQVIEHRWKETERGKTEQRREKPVPVPLCPPQMRHGVSRD